MYFLVLRIRDGCHPERYSFWFGCGMDKVKRDFSSNEELLLTKKMKIFLTY